MEVWPLPQKLLLPETKVNFWEDFWLWFNLAIDFHN